MPLQWYCCTDVIALGLLHCYYCTDTIALVPVRHGHLLLGPYIANQARVKMNNSVDGSASAYPDTSGQTCQGSSPFW